MPPYQLDTPLAYLYNCLMPSTLASRSNPPCYFRLEISEAWRSIRMHKEL